MSYDFTIRQGETFQRVVRWEIPPFVYKPIQSISQAAPVQIVSAAHGLVNGWRVAVVSVKGMTEINAKNDPLRSTDFNKATVINANTVELNKVNAADFSEYESGGYLKYYTPAPLAGFTARMTIKDRVGGTVLVALVSPTNIVIDDAAKTITVTIAATATAAFATGRYVYDLEMVNGAVVTTILSGEIEVTPEVTT